uniref:Uncharacterized protein n=1 Tax=Globodera rostochiensis TaxID=31243 RepID=A0A914H2H3_GLORO
MGNLLSVEMAPHYHAAQPEEHCPEPFHWTFFPLLALTLAMSIVLARVALFLFNHLLIKYLHRPGQNPRVEPTPSYNPPTPAPALDRQVGIPRQPPFPPPTPQGDIPLPPPRAPRNHSNLSTAPPNRRTPPSVTPTYLFLAVLVIIFSTPHISARPTAKNWPKAVAKNSLPLLASSALYFGVDAISSAVEKKEPEPFPISLPVALTCLGILLLLTILKILTLFINFRKPPSPSDNPPIELGEISSALQELINRSNPPNK